MAFIDMTQIIMKMFKNPLKYQTGGSTPTQQQEQQLVQMFQKASENTGIPVETLVEGLNQITDENQKKAVTEAVAFASKGDRTAIETLQKMFKTSSQSQAFKNGGKIHDFICKHAKGGVAGCGCGGSVVKAERGLGRPGLSYLGEYSEPDGFSSRQHNVLAHS